MEFGSERRSAHCVAIVAGALLLLTPLRSASATVQSLTVTVPNCQAGAETVPQCYDTGFLSNQIVDATDSFIGGFPNAQSDLFNFTDAFNNWNAANGHLWHLVDGGALPVSFTTNVTVDAGTFTGGINPIIVSIDYSPTGNDPTLAQLVWTQALVINYSPTSVDMVSPPAVTLDTYSLSAGSGGSGGAFLTACEPIPGQTPGPNNSIASSIGATASGQAYCDPIYPFQYGPSTVAGPDPFADAPQGLWPNDAFRGIALLSTVTFDTDASGNITDRVLTAYEGISYGFNLSVVPEPATLVLLLGPAAATLMLRRRRYSVRGSNCSASVAQ
jgi:hypothetical protein